MVRDKNTIILTRKTFMTLVALISPSKSNMNTFMPNIIYSMQ